MGFNFPNSPTVGDTFISGGAAWQWDGTVWKQAVGQAALAAFIQQQVLTSATAGAIVLHADTKAFLVEVQGGGGGGGTALSSAANQATAAAGGGGGGYCSKWIIRPSGAYSPACSIGAAVAGATAGNGSQFVDGTNTLTAGGGAVGSNASGSANWSWAGGAGGAATGGDINVPGQRGLSAIELCLAAGAVGNCIAGNGGSSRFGSGGLGAVYLNNVAGGSVGGVGSGYGAGGGGGAATYGGGGYGGGGGSGGCVIITEFR